MSEQITEIEYQGERYSLGGSGGESGATFTPEVSQEGVISWTNDKDLPNPDPVNIKGPKGEDGAPGQQGAPGTYTEIVEKMTMGASDWRTGVYSFESHYPHDEYNVFIEPDGDRITNVQYQAWCDAKLVGMCNINGCKSLGDVPTVNIPIILRAVSIGEGNGRIYAGLYYDSTPNPFPESSDDVADLPDGYTFETGSYIYVVDTGNLYMYEGNGGEWVLQ